MARPWLLALCLGLCASAPDAQASLVFDETNLNRGSEVLVEVLADPDDPQVAWVASERTVWVTDDGGDAWYVVAQLAGDPRNLGQDNEDTQEETTPEWINESDDEDDEEDDDEEDTSDETAPTEAGGMARLGRSTGRADAALSPIRLRLMDGQVFFASERGLWAIDRGARTVGSAVEIRLGRSLAVRDLIQAPWGEVLLATDQGLRLLDDLGRADARPGALADRDIHCLVSIQGAVVAGTTEGLWRVTEGGTTRVGAVGVQGPRDLLALTAGQLLVSTGSDLSMVDIAQGQVTQRWSVSGTRRLAQDRDGRLWAVGADGPWSWTAPGSGKNDAGTWLRRTRGLGDRRLSGVAATRGGGVHLWVIGRGGAWRRVSERVWLIRERERVSDLIVDEGAPPVWSLLEAAEEAHQVERERVDRLRRASQWAFLLPHVLLKYQYDMRREEDLVAIPELDQHLLTQVQVVPRDHELLLHVTWDLRPVIWGFVEENSPYGGPSVANETLRALGARERIRNAIVGLYNLWAERRVTWRTSSPPSSRAAIKAILGLQHIEADLHVLSDGAFTPMTTLETILEGGNP